MKRELHVAGAGRSGRSTLSRDSEAIMQGATDNFYKVQDIREVVARTIYTTPSEALKGMAEILHIIDGRPPTS